MNDEMFGDLLKSVDEGGKILRGELTPSRKFEFEPVNVKGIRERMHLTQSKFADLMGISIATLRNWEQGRRRPEGPALVLLNVVDKRPDALWDINIHDSDEE